VATVTSDEPLSVPALFAAAAVDAADDPFARAVAAARADGEPGTLLWSPRPDRADCAVILGPETALADAVRVAFVASNGIGDALGALVPPGIPLVFGWPDRIVINGLAAGGIRVVWPDATTPDAVPPWVVVGIRILVTLDVEAAGDDVSMTNLFAEGCNEITAREILESFSRHFLYWIDRWLDEGFAPVKTAWLARAANYGPNENMEMRGPWADRTLLRMNDNGDIVYTENGDEHAECLRNALQTPSWLANA
jgi:biotin-(acetyl-CoA carboxylase) ligase